MTQAQFMRVLARRLRGLPESERKEVLRYYREFLQDAQLDPKADVTPLVGTPNECARGILADSLIRQEQDAATQSAWKRFRLVLLGIFAAPIALPLAIVAFALVVTVFAVLAALFVSGITLAVSGVAFLPAAFFMAGSLAQGLIVAGYGLLLISVGVLLVIGTTVLWRLCVRGLAALLRRKGA